MKQKILDVVGLLFVLALITAGFALCSEDIVQEGATAVEERCNTEAVDALRAGASAERAVAEHAQCLRRVR